MGFFIVLGLGRFGSTLSLKLKEKGHEILAADMNEKIVKSLEGELPDAVQADVREKDALLGLGVKDADAVIVAIGESLEASILCTLNLINIGVRKIYAKVKSEEHGQVLKALGVEDSCLIFPERDSAHKLADSLSTKNIMDIIPLEDDYKIAIFGLPNSFIGKSLRQLDLRKKYQVQVLGIKDTLQSRWNMVPSPDEILKDSDELMVLGREENIKRFSNIK